MDSKLKKWTILAAVSVILMTFFIVLLLNTDMGRSAGKPSDGGQETEQNTGIVYQSGQIGNDLSAFMRDDTFFDPERNEYLENLYENQNRLSLVAISIERDLRIQIVNNENKPVTGESFFVEIEGVGEYKDLDKDGVLYIGGLPAGNYEVSLQPIAGYRVPTESTTVRVKDRVEYVMIDDISLLIKTEEEIDAEAEDTAQAIDDADNTEIKRAQEVSGSSSLGIDVSKWQGEIDWEKVKNAGIDFVIIRCGYRGSVTGSLVEDPYFRQNIKGAIAEGLKVGVYFFTQAVNEVEAVEEASMVISLIRDYELDYPIFIDTEGAGGGRADGLDTEERTLICQAFCSTITNAGYEAGVYASRNWYNRRLTTSQLERNVIWLAEYRNAPLYEGYYQIWQYTSKGTVDGIEGNVDMNISYMTR